MTDNSESPFKPGILKGHTAFVTGGGSGIGLEIARQLGLHGCNVMIMGRREDVLQSAAKMMEDEKIPVAYYRGDVRQFESCQKAVAACISQFGGLSILINCAAGNFLTPAEDLTPKGFKTVIDIDTMGTFNMSHASFKELKKAGNSLIINISATLHYGATWYQSHASAAKAAVDSLTRSLGVEWGDYGIRVCGIAPGPIADTGGAAKLGGGLAGASGMVAKEYLSGIPLQRLGTKWEIGMACVYLASSAGAYITGETLVVDGGAWLARPPRATRDVVRNFSRAIEKSSREVGLAHDQPKIKSSL